MAYELGTVASPAELAAAISAFAVSNGWTQSGSVLSFGDCYVELTSTANMVQLRGAKGGDFNAPNLCPRTSRIYLTNWPASMTYHLVAAGSPATLWCTVNWDVTVHMHIGFGEVEKYGDWVGGAWFHAQHTQTAIDGNVRCLIDGETPGTGLVFGCGLFWSQRDKDTWNNGNRYGKASMLHCELRGEIWATTGQANDSSDLQTILCPSILKPIHKYNPNLFNGQTLLTPFELYLQNTDGYYMPIGHVGHLRMIQLDNYNPGDVLTIGSDRWKVFPWYQLDLANPDGANYSTGVMGVAVRYDGP